MAEKIKNDPNLVVNRKELIEIFDEGKTVKEMKVTRKTNKEKK